MLEIIKLISVLLTFLFITGCSNTKINPCNGDTKVYSSISMETDKKICFKSIDSYDLNYKNKPEIIIYGNLIFPKTKKDKYNAVILSHGSGGLRKYHDRYVDLLTNNGYVVFQIDHYLGRDIKYDKTFSKVSGITFMNDSFKALELIKTHPKINKVAYIGWSQGGVGPILSHFSQVTDLINSSMSLFDASVAIYPYCGFTFNKLTKTNNPLLILTGRDDDLTPEQACINIYKKFSTNEKKIKHISLEGARHGYDNPFLFFGFTFDKLPSLHIINDECTLTISNIGEMKTISNKKISGPKESAKLLDKCSTKGVSVKYSPYATEKTYIEIIEFLKRI
jgi:dienelactone hydrolase